MIPYSDLFYFYVVGLVLIPAIVLGVLEKKIKYYGLFATLLLIGLIFHDSAAQLTFLLLFYLEELLLIKSYLLIKKRFGHRWIFILFLILALLPLALAKWGEIFTGHPLGFLGISYLTFKVIQMLIEIKSDLIHKISVLNFTYFLMFFPTISSGPIDRSRRFEQDVERILPRKEYLNDVRHGLKKIGLGAGYKFILGVIIFTYWLEKIPPEPGILHTLSYMYAYSFYLFFDFAGYSLMAVGVGYLLGVKTPDNFSQPFKSKTIKEFWDRWHISLSSWFRDFLYTRFVMSAIKKKWFKNKLTGSYLGYIITMTTMGIWHGTEKHYIIYGLYHGILLVLTDIIQRKSHKYNQYKNTPLGKLASIFITFQLVCFGFLIFSGYLFNE